MAYTGPAVNIANWIKNGANAAQYQTGASTPALPTFAAGDVIIQKGDVSAASGTLIKDTNYGDDIRDFLVAVLDSVQKVYAAQTGTAIPSNFSVVKAITGSEVQFVVKVTMNGDVDFPALA